MHTREQDPFRIQDLGSKNGTFVNGDRLASRSHTLRNGDRIELARGKVALPPPDVSRPGDLLANA